MAGDNDVPGEGTPEAVARIEALSRALEEARAEISRLRVRVRSLERQAPKSGRQTAGKRAVMSSVRRHLVEEAIALGKYGCSQTEIAERLQLKEADVAQILENPQQARGEAKP